MSARRAPASSKRAEPASPSSARRPRAHAKPTAALGRGIASAVVIKEGDVFLVVDQDGSIPMKGPHGFGLYLHDCRFLDGYEIQIDGRDPIVLVATAAAGSRGIFELTNPELPGPDGRALREREIGLRWDRSLDDAGRVLHEVLRARSFSAEPVDLTLTLSFRSTFEDVYALRGLCDARPGTLHPARWEGDLLRLRYDGADDIVRTTDIHFERRPDRAEANRACFAIHLDPGAEAEIALSITLGESHPRQRQPVAPDTSDAAEHARMTEVRTDHVPLARAVERCLGDLAVLRSRLGPDAYYAAGVPWYVALFGRDSLLTALGVLAYNPEIAAHTLRLLARHQGRADDPSRDEEPGKILHELRVGELAHVGAIPHTPYYGTVDATPLFLVLLARHAAWTGRMDLFHELRPNVEAALDWIFEHGQSKETGYVEYRTRAPGGLANQGWKDSDDAIMLETGQLARQPIALVEVQGYTYLAFREIAVLLDRAGEPLRAAALRQEAEALKQRFVRDFWLPDKGYFALARTPDGPARVLSSNAGQALWSGIAGPDEARRTMEHLLSEAMFSGWGIRTLSADERRYNPVAYHRGTVWPHDNAIILAGFRHHGFDDAACRVFEGILAASAHFRMHRLPELFAGFRRADFGVPVHYPVACHPQAWAAASVPFMIERLLGLSPEAFDNRLRVVRPVLPPAIETLDLRGLRVGTATVDLAFTRLPDGRAEARVTRCDGPLDVQVDRDGESVDPA
ncbi:MAG: glycogen debranching N-terminal domain-containing protein [Minicystis sp.]